jgi:hypothetical protein
MISVTKLIKTCDACPAQWEGETEEGKYVYIRFRFGQLRIEVDKEVVYQQKVGGMYDGDMNFKQLRDLVSNILFFKVTQVDQEKCPVCGNAECDDHYEPRFTADDVSFHPDRKGSQYGRFKRD